MHIFKFNTKIEGPFNFELTVRKPAGWHWATLFEIFEDEALFTALRLSSNKLVGIKLKAKNNLVTADAFSDLSLSEKNELTELVKLGLGASEDIEGFYELASKDDLVRSLKSDLYGMRIGFPTGIFERALLAISLQMAPPSRSDFMMECLIKRYGERAQFEDKEIRYWPSANKIADQSVSDLAQKCNLGYRAKYVKGVAEKIANGFPDIIQISKLNEEEAVKKLESLPGIGSYSAQIISPNFGFPLDVWSGRIFHEILFGETPPKPRKIIKKVEREASRRWGKYKSYVFVYVLNDLRNLSKHFAITRLT